jgi:ribosomal protein S18 acetylase RimI-like enzyme
MAVSQQSPEVSINRAMSADIPGILDCLREAFEDYRLLYPPDAYLDTVLTAETLRQRLTKMLVYVAVSSSKQIAGTIACNVLHSEEGHIRGMAVLRKWRGTGLAARLLSFAESELRIRKCTRVTLDTTEPLQRAMRFYEKQRYRRSGKIADFFGMRLIEYHKAL